METNPAVLQAAFGLSPGSVVKTAEDHPIIVFDARCVLCSANAQFVLKQDRAARFRLTSIQSDAGIRLYHRFGLDAADPETMLLIENGRLRRDSDAVLAIFQGLGWPWRMAAVARLIPRPVRDSIYRWVARNRYRLFGQRRTCWVPPPEQAWRIL